jgi:Ca2+-transporting ATPase
MQVKAIYDFKQDVIIDITEGVHLQNDDLLLSAVLASESNPFDSMEKAIWETYQLHTGGELHRKFKMIYEYPLEGRPPMMTHVYQHGDSKVIAAKGAAERILKACKLEDASFKKVTSHVQSLAANGYRVIGVASAMHADPELPARQDDFGWTFMGLLALYDPPKKNTREVLKKIADAKIEVKLLTGDYSETAINIAGQVGFSNHLRCINGDEVMSMKEEELQTIVKNTSVFARMFPDAKLKVINALKKNGEIVAMTGDGVNDAPALKASDIGIAMGQKGTEAARQVSDLILTDDNLEKIVTAISEGRKIFINLIKAVRYIISIHIPIILTASLPVVLGWNYPNIFTPIHVIFLELIMGPTCSIFFENEPLEKDNMLSGPRSRTAGLFTSDELLIGIVQGLGITAGVLILYYVFMNNHYTVKETRTIVFTTLILSNVFLTFATRSFTKTIYYTSRYKNGLVPVIIIVSVVFLLLLHLVPAIRNLFELAPIALSEFWLSFGVAFASVMWFEVYKMDLWHGNRK